MEITIIILVGFLIIAQIILAIHQIRKHAYDGPILLGISIGIAVIWTPLSVFKLLYPKNIPVYIAWLVIAILYMAFTIWYTNMLSKSFKDNN